MVHLHIPVQNWIKVQTDEGENVSSITDLTCFGRCGLNGSPQLSLVTPSGNWDWMTSQSWVLLASLGFSMKPVSIQGTAKHPFECEKIKRDKPKLCSSLSPEQINALLLCGKVSRELKTKSSPVSCWKPFSHKKYRTSLNSQMPDILFPLWMLIYCLGSFIFIMCQTQHPAHNSRLTPHKFYV